MAAEPWGLSLSEKLLPQYLGEIGYRNHIVGKWHLGHYQIKYTPLFRGFESHLGFWTGHHDYYDHVAVEKSFSVSHFLLISWKNNLSNYFQIFFGFSLNLSDFFNTMKIKENGKKVLKIENKFGESKKICR